MRILLVNDDGYDADGIIVLKKTLLQHGHDIFVCAPNSNKSGSSHSINLGGDIKVCKINEREYVCTGSPADCVMTALRGTFSFGAPLFEKIDIVLSGINQGPNIGLDIVYSGTCAAARQAVLYGVPSAALSVMVSDAADETFAPAEKYHYEAMANFAEKNLENFIKMCVVARGLSMPHKKCVFVNVNGLSQSAPYKKARFAGISFREYEGDAIKLFPKTKDVFFRKFSGGKVFTSSRGYSDFDALTENCASVSRVFAEPSCDCPIDKIQFVL